MKISKKVKALIHPLCKGKYDSNSWDEKTGTEICNSCIVQGECPYPSEEGCGLPVYLKPIKGDK